jgi:ferredoxin
VDAIMGEMKEVHRIDEKECTRCGACRNVCNVDAVEVV